MAHLTLSGIAILGAGLFVAEAYLPALATLGPTSFSLKAVYSRSEKSSSETAQNAAKILGLSSSPDVYFDGDHPNNLDALLARSDIAAVIIALPITLQPEIVVKCLLAGKHVLSEKPVAPDVAQGLKLLEDAEPICQQYGLVWRVAENFEAEPVYRAAGEAIRSGKIGSVIFFKASVVNFIDKTSKWYKTPWRTVPDYQGGFLLDGGVHTIAALRTMLPEPFTHLSGFASLNKEYLSPHDTIHCVVRAQSHYHGIVEMTFASPTKSIPAAENLVITGSKGWLACNTTSEGFKIVVKVVEEKESGKTGEEAEYKEREEIISFPRKGVETELAAFFDAIGRQGTGESALDIGNPREALKDVAFIQAALNSEGNLIDLLELIQASS
ncbi:oxidoreductase family protein [Lentinula edodes]|uniref:Oxidoreductase family protein n=1 Tax=Lentinula edodes TaxID=5353 RepID=A0A1Q3DVP4_LENED|nr:oxidoreductase family protein [Lentinula edodes]